MAGARPHRAAGGRGLAAALLFTNIASAAAGFGKPVALSDEDFEKTIGEVKAGGKSIFVKFLAPW